MLVSPFLPQFFAVTLQIVQQFSKLDQLSRKAIYDMSAFESYSLKHEQTWDSPTIKRISLSSHVCPGFLRKSHNMRISANSIFPVYRVIKCKKKKKYTIGHSIYYIQLNQASNCTMLLLGPIIQGKIRRVLPKTGLK